MANRWRCGHCGYRLEADTPSEQCPGCRRTCEWIDDNPYVPVETPGETGYEVVPPELQPRIIAEKCTACGDCIEACPIEAISLRDGVAWIDPDICDGDAICIPACPEHAIVPPE